MTPSNVPDPKPDTTLTIEHLKPLHLGGASNYINTAASCLGCNNKRTKKRYVRGKDVPIVRLQPKTQQEPRVKKDALFTYIYTIPRDPDTLVLCNLPHDDEDEAIDHFRMIENGPVTLKRKMLNT